jgi:hypothetical protein
MMRMLDAGGLPVYAENRLAYESPAVLGLPQRSEFLSQCLGHAVKILEPLHYTPPPGYPYRSVLMQRDYEQQALSQRKFLNFLEQQEVVRMSQVSRLASSIRRDMPKMKALLATLGPVLPVRFEDILRHPAETCATVAAFLELPLDQDAMQAQIVPRPALCLPTFLEMSFMASE